MLTYAEAKTMMERARNGRRKLENNTWLEEREVAIKSHVFGGAVWAAGGAKLAGLSEGDYQISYAVRLHSTDVVTIHPDGSYTLDSGGWRTVTTKDRINHYAPGAVSADRMVWYYYPKPGEDWKTRFEFRDGMKVTAPRNGAKESAK